MDFWNNKKVLVTGGTGMLGIALTNKLSDYCTKLVVFSRSQPKNNPQITWIKGDVSKKSDFENLVQLDNIDIIFHLAGSSQVSHSNLAPTTTFNSNIKGTWNILDVVRQNTKLIPVFLASTIAVDGLLGMSDPSKELSPYSASKFCVEILAGTYFFKFDVPVTCIRFPNLFGPEDSNYNRLIPETIISILNGKSPVIKSRSSNTVNFLYVEDAVLALLEIAESTITSGTYGKTYSIPSYSPIKLNDIVLLILKLMEKEELEPILNGIDAPRKIKKDFALLESTTFTDWEPQFQIEEGLLNTIAWYSKKFKKSI